MKATARRRLVLLSPALALAGLTGAYGAYPWFCRRSASAEESTEDLPGDSIVADPREGYTLAVSIRVPPAQVWPWLIQMGQGRGGFYTHERVENLLGADIHNADSIIPEFQRLSVGDSVRLTPDPYRGQQGQHIVVAALSPAEALVFRQELPNGSTGSWAYVLRASPSGTRLIFRRRGGRPSPFDRVMLPGYYFMDMGMLAGIKRRAERRSDA